MIFRYSIILLTILLLATFFTPYLAKTSAQSYNESVPGLFWATWGGSRNNTGDAVATDKSGNIYAVGSTDSFGAGLTDALLLKYNANGSLNWTRTWGGANVDVGIGVAIDPSSQGGVYITGDTLSFGSNPAIFLVKFTLEGNLTWQETWNGNVAEHVKDIAMDPAGNVLLTGETASFGAGNYDVFLFKFDSNGALLWQRSWGGTGVDLGAGVASDSTGDIYLTGSSSSFGPIQSAILLKFNSTGNLLWQRAWNSSQGAVGDKLALDSQDNAYLAGNTSSFGAGGLDVLLMKFNNTGDLLWQRTWGSNETDFAGGIGVGPGGDILVSGSSAGNAFMLKLNSTGIPASFTTFGYRKTSQALGLVIDPSGDAIATGFSAIAVTGYPSLPLLFRSGNDTLGFARFNITSPTISPQTPNIQVGNASGTVSSPAGTQYQFYGTQRDLLLFKYYAHPAVYHVTLSGYADTFGGVFPHTGNYTEGTYVATQHPPLCDCYLAHGWNSTGGVILASNPTFYQVVVNLLGSGNLTAPGWGMNYYPYQRHPVLPGGLMLTALVLFLPVLFFFKRRGVVKNKIRFDRKSV